MKLRAREKKILVRCGLLAYLSGAALYVLSHWVRVQTAVGEQHHPAERWARVAHSALTYGVVFAIGYLLHAHILPGLRVSRPKRRRSGLGSLSIFTLLLASALFMLYAGEVEWRGTVAQVHGLVGLGLPTLLLFHSRTMKRRTRRD